MKKLKLLYVLIIALAINSCNLMTDEEWEALTDTENDLTTIERSKVFRGGNVDCDQLSDILPDMVLKTTGRNDYNASEDVFAYGWPAGLEVKVYDDSSVSFAIVGALDLGDGLCYRVAAVIVKGSDASNVYTYADGATHDINLTPPDNASLGSANLSNLTFCFLEVKCEEPEELVVAFKSLTSGPAYFVTTGEYINSRPSSFPLVLGGSYPIYYEGTPVDRLLVGHLSVSDNNSDGYWEITADNLAMPTVQFIKPYLYAGTTEGYLNLTYSNYPYPDPKVTILPTNTWTFTLPFKLQ